MSHSDDRFGDDGGTGGTAAGANNPESPRAAQPAQSTGTADRGSTAPADTRAEVRREDDHTTRESFIGAEHRHRASNVSWGAIFAGTVMFLAVMVVFGLISAALGLGAAGGVAVGIWSVIALLLALAVAGYVAGALAVRGGLLHGLVTWATSLVGLLLLIGWVGASILGTIGGALGGIAQGAVGAAGAADVTTEDLGQAAQDAAEDIDPEQAQEQADQAAQDAQQQLDEAQSGLQATAWWSVAGMVVGAAVAGFAGVAGSRSVQTPDTEVRAGSERRSR